jgi:hypothetical protein
MVGVSICGEGLRADDDDGMAKGNGKWNKNKRRKAESVCFTVGDGIGWRMQENASRAGERKK